MGLYDRDYYRETPRGLGNWMPGRVTTGLIAFMVGLFVVQILSKSNRGGQDDLLRYGCFDLQPILAGEVWRVITAPFLHNSVNLWPILFSMLVLYYFGRGLEDDIGGPELLCFYLAAVVVTQAAEFTARLANLEPSDGISFGSVGPVTALVVLYACRHPRETVRLFFVIPVPMWSIAVAIVVLNLIGVLRLGSRSEPVLPLAGAAFALAYFKLNLRLSAYLNPGPRRTRQHRPKLRVLSAVDDEPVAVHAVNRDSQVDEQLEAKVDAVLEKVSRQGPESLSAEENELLRRASEVYRKRRE